jgi:hypothetical protein
MPRAAKIAPVRFCDVEAFMAGSRRPSAKLSMPTTCGACSTDEEGFRMSDFLDKATDSREGIKDRIEDQRVDVVKAEDIPAEEPVDEATSTEE